MWTIRDLGRAYRRTLDPQRLDPFRCLRVNAGIGGFILLVSALVLSIAALLPGEEVDPVQILGASFSTLVGAALLLGLILSREAQTVAVRRYLALSGAAILTLGVTAAASITSACLGLGRYTRIQVSLGLVTLAVAYGLRQLLDFGPSSRPAWALRAVTAVVACGALLEVAWVVLLFAPWRAPLPAARELGERSAAASRVIEILYSDTDVVAVDKPSGLLVHRSNVAPDRDVLLQRVRDAIEAHVYPVHRLDRATSGVVVFARSPEAARAIQAALETAEKVYVALVRGITPDAGVMERPLSDLDTGRAQHARTEYRRVLVLDGRLSLLEVRPRTGRQHQIRRHFAHEAHHVLGDTTYGKGRINREYRERAGLHRLALHAARLELDLPSGRRAITAPLPADLAGPLSRMAGFDPAALSAGG